MHSCSGKGKINLPVFQSQKGKGKVNNISLLITEYQLGSVCHKSILITRQQEDTFQHRPVLAMPHITHILPFPNYSALIPLSSTFSFISHSPPFISYFFLASPLPSCMVLVLHPPTHTQFSQLHSHHLPSLVMVPLTPILTRLTHPSIPSQFCLIPHLSCILITSSSPHCSPLTHSLTSSPHPTFPHSLPFPPRPVNPKA